MDQLHLKSISATGSAVKQEPADSQAFENASQTVDGSCSYAADSLTIDGCVTASGEPSIKCEKDSDISQHAKYCSLAVDSCSQAADSDGCIIKKQDIPITPVDSKCMVHCKIKDTPQLKMEVDHKLCVVGEPVSQLAIKSENDSDVDDPCTLTEITTSCGESPRTDVRNRDMLNHLVELRGVIDDTPGSTVIQHVVKQDTDQRKTSDDLGGMVCIKLKGM